MPEDGSILSELLLVHGAIRRDLETVRELVQSVQNGAPAEEIRSEVAQLKSNGILWKLRLNCLQYCRFVHSHHNAEDAMLFPAVRAEDPGLNEVVDKLEADHRVVSDQLDEVEAAVRGPLEDEQPARARLAGALQDLEGHLLEHLNYEEESIGPTLDTWKSIPPPRPPTES